MRALPLHGLRHGAASLMLAAGTDIALVLKRLGHSSVSITADTNSHLLASARGSQRPGDVRADREVLARHIANFVVREVVQIGSFWASG